MISCCCHRRKEITQVQENPVFITSIHGSPGHLDLTKVLEREVEIGTSGEIPSPKTVYVLDAGELYDPRTKV